MSESYEYHTQAAEYALGLLSSDEAKRFEARLASDSDLQAAYIFWAEHFATLSHEWHSEEPPASLKQRIEQAAFGTANNKVTQLPRKRKTTRPIWAIAAAVLLTFGIWSLVPSSFDATYQTSLVATETDLAVDVLVDAESKTLRIITKRGAAAIEGDYELWVAIGDGAPMSLGVLDLSDVQERTLDVPWLSGLTNAHMAISHEPKGGSPTGAPTGPVLAVADTITL